MPEQALDLTKLDSFVKGTEAQESELKDWSVNVPDQFARVIKHGIDKKAYHRKNTVLGLINLMAYSNKEYRNIAWALIQELPFSHLLELPELIKDANKEQTRRLRTAIMYKILNSNFQDILRGYFIAPSKYRLFFKYLRLPTTEIKDTPITNSLYKSAREIADLSIPQVMKNYSINPFGLVSIYGIPLEKVFEHITTDDVNSVIDIANSAKGDTFFHHARWFRDFLGADAFNELALGKFKSVKNPDRFTAIRKHLEETETLSTPLLNEMDRRAKQHLEQIVKDAKLNRYALLVDVSGSMERGRNITAQLYRAFSHLGKVTTDTIVFDTTARNVEPDRIGNLPCQGATSIGAAFVLLYQNLDQRLFEDCPEAVLLITDMGQNTRPSVKDGIILLKTRLKVPIIILRLSSPHFSKANAIAACDLQDIPHSMIDISEFHSSLLQDIIKEIALLGGQVKATQEVTEIIKERIPFEETLGAIHLPVRPAATLRKNYLKSRLV